MAADKSSTSATSSCSLDSLRLRIFSARAWPPRARSSGVKAWAGAPFLSSAEARAGTLIVVVRDDGVGGADPSGGSGLLGLKDRAEAIGGRISLESPHGDGTTLRVELPLGDRNSSAAGER
jgi:hypothetical protein